MVTVTLSTKIQIGKKTIIIKSVDPMITVLSKAMVEGTAVHLKLLAFGARDLLIDKLLVKKPLKGRPVLKRQPDKRGSKVPDEPPEWKKRDIVPKIEKIMNTKKLLPPRSLGKPKVRRVPFKRIPRLSEMWVDKKIETGLDPRELMSSGEYLRGIVIRKVKMAEVGVYYVVTLANREHSSGIMLGKLAKMLEFGTSAFTIPLFGDPERVVTIKLPPRKHWKPAFKEILKARAEIGHEARAAALEEKLKEIQ